MRPVANTEHVLAVSKAVHEVVDEFYVKNSIEFDIIVLKEFYQKVPEVHSTFLSIPGNFSYNLVINHGTHNDDIVFQLRKSAMFFAYSCLSYQAIHYDYVLTNVYPHPLKFLVYVDNCDINFLSRHLYEFIQAHRLTVSKGSIENFEFLLVNQRKFLYLMSIEWFTTESCNQAHLVILNTYNKITKKWSKKLQFHEKFQNFHGCELVMLLYARDGGDKWGTYIFDNETNKFIPFGLVPMIYEQLSKNFNYTIGYLAGKIDNTQSIFHDNYGVTLADPDVLPTVCFEVIRISDTHFAKSHTSTRFLEVRDLILVTPGELYSPFEKLFLPFDDFTWKLINLTFFVAFLAIFIINQLPKIFQNIIYGENVTTPFLNVVSTFFGISQIKLPMGNFPRFILTMFVLFCLIFRTCYQSKLFEFMTSEPRRPPPKTIEDLIDRNYTMYALSYFAVPQDQIVSDSKWPVMKYVNIPEYKKIFMTQSQNSSAKIALVMQSLVLQNFEMEKGASMNWLQINDFYIQVSQSGFTFFANNFFFGVVDSVMQRLIDTGIMNKLVGDLVGVKRKFLGESEPQVLTVENLNFGFIIWLWCCGICVCGFVWEIIMWNLRNVLTRFGLKKLNILDLEKKAKINDLKGNRQNLEKVLVLLKKRRNFEKKRYESDKEVI